MSDTWRAAIAYRLFVAGMAGTGATYATDTLLSLDPSDHELDSWLVGQADDVTGKRITTVTIAAGDWSLLTALAAVTVLLERAGDQPGRYIGVWRDVETGLIHLDVSDRLSDRGDAMRTARARGELAVWNVRDCHEERISALVA